MDPNDGSQTKLLRKKVLKCYWKHENAVEVQRQCTVKGCFKRNHQKELSPLELEISFKPMKLFLMSLKRILEDHVHRKVLQSY